MRHQGDTSGRGLLEADHPDDEGYGIDGGYGQLEGVVLPVVGDDEDVVAVASGFDALDECPLVGVDDIHLVPLEEEAGHCLNHARMGILAISHPKRGGTPLLMGLLMVSGAICQVLWLTTCNDVKNRYPALAISEVDASDTCFSFSIVICRICSFNRPISSACC